MAMMNRISWIKRFYLLSGYGWEMPFIAFLLPPFVGGVLLSLSKHILDDLSGLIRSPVFCVSYFFLIIESVVFSQGACRVLRI